MWHKYIKYLITDLSSLIKQYRKFFRIDGKIVFLQYSAIKQKKRRIMHQQLLKEIELGSKNALIKKKFVKYYIYNGSATITDLSKELGPQCVPTVTKFISEMCEEGYINDYGKLETVWRTPPQPLRTESASATSSGWTSRNSPSTSASSNFKETCRNKRWASPIVLRTRPKH